VPNPPPFKIGDLVERIMSFDECEARQERDRKKAKMLGKPGYMFLGNAAAYMHGDEAYVVVGITKSGGLRLRGFAPTVSATDVRASTLPVCR
jgi:hypothetical protein